MHKMVFPKGSPFSQITVRGGNAGVHQYKRGFIHFTTSDTMKLTLIQLWARILPKTHFCQECIFVLHMKQHSKHIQTAVRGNADGPCSTEWVIFTDRQLNAFLKMLKLY